jgi:hypothetical protein
MSLFVKRCIGSKKLCVLFCLLGHLFASPSIVFVHLGPSIPSYVPTAVHQARLFNPDLPIYLLANQAALKNYPQDDQLIQCIAVESLPFSRAHKKFIASSRLDKKFRGGFWTFATERFFCLADFLRQYKLSDVFHLENDVMLYANLKELLPVFSKYYPNMIGATFDNDHRCIPGFLYIATLAPLQRFVDFIVQNLDQLENDMHALSLFKKKYRKQWIEHLPIVMSEYVKDPNQPRVENLSDFSTHFQEFNSIFDAAAIGQYLGGIDPRNGDSSPGFINESCVFSPAAFQFEWQKDDQERQIPTVCYQGKKWKVNNLHIHSKNLAKFDSKIQCKAALLSHRPSSAPFVSGDTFRAFSDWVYDELDTSLDPKKVQRGNIIFVKTDYLGEFFQKIHPQIDAGYILISHNSDDPAPGRYASFLADDKLLAWFAQNYDGCSHAKMHPIPIGLANAHWPHGDVEQVLKIQNKHLPKKHLAYLNMNVQTFSEERKQVFDFFSKSAYCHKQTDRKYKKFLKDVASSQFVISPRGNGLDTHRLWEALYLGSIPIVKSSSLDSLYQGLPVLIISDWKEVTEEFLKKKQRELSGQTFFEEKLSIAYWMSLIRSAGS